MLETVQYRKVAHLFILRFGFCFICLIKLVDCYNLSQIWRKKTDGQVLPKSCLISTSSLSWQKLCIADILLDTEWIMCFLDILGKKFFPLNNVSVWQTLTPGTWALSLNLSWFIKKKASLGCQNELGYLSALRKYEL